MGEKRGRGRWGAGREGRGAGQRAAPSGVGSKARAGQGGCKTLQLRAVLSCAAPLRPPPTRLLRPASPCMRPSSRRFDSSSSRSAVTSMRSMK